MGLDMYLEGERYLWSWGAVDDSGTGEAIAALFPEITGKTVKTVGVELMYWRKANAIHAWFVRNVQNGVDDCGRYSVSLDQLRELKSACDTVLADRSKAATVLPTQSGFFFGSTDYDEHFYADLEDTSKSLAGLLLRDDLAESWRNWDFYYRASW